MPFKYSPLKSFYYRNRYLGFGLLAFLGAVAVLLFFYSSCNRSSKTLYEIIFNKPPGNSVRLYNSQDRYLFDCCLWIHFKTDSSEFNSVIVHGFDKKESDGGEWDQVVPPEAKGWWYPNKLGEKINYYVKETDSTSIGVYCNPTKTEAFAVYYFK